MKSNAGKFQRALREKLISLRVTETDEAQMQKWEYLRVVASSDSDGRILDITANEEEVFSRSSESQNLEFSLFDYLTKLGKEGWEMVNALPWWGRDIVIYFFKRPIE